MAYKNRFYKVIKPLSLLLLILTSIVMSIILIEVIVRVSPWIPKTDKSNALSWVTGSGKAFYELDPSRIYKITAGVDLPGTFLWGSDEDGFRFNPSHSGRSKNDYKNIVVLGDSMIYGQGSPHDETFPSLLEKELNLQGHNVWIDNAGTPGYSLDQAFVYLKDEIAPKIKPDLVIWGLSQNDLYEANYSCLFTKIGNNYYQLSGKLNTFYMKEKYFNKFHHFAGNSHFLTLIEEKIPHNFTPGCSQKEPSYIDLRQKAEYFFKEFKEMGEKENFDTMFVIVLNQHFFETFPSFEDWELRVSLNKELNNFYIYTANNLGITIIDTNEYITGSKNSNGKTLGYTSEPQLEYPNYFIDEPITIGGFHHPNTAGNKLMSEQAVSVIEKLILKNSLINK